MNPLDHLVNMVRISEAITPAFQAPSITWKYWSKRGPALIPIVTILRSHPFTRRYLLISTFANAIPQQKNSLT